MCGKFLLYFDLIFKAILIFIVVVRETTPIQKHNKAASEVVDGKFLFFFRFDLKINPIFVVVVGETTPIQRPNEAASEVVDGKFLVRVQ